MSGPPIGKPGHVLQDPSHLFLNQQDLFGPSHSTSTSVTPLNSQCCPKKAKSTPLISGIAQRTINQLWLIHI